MNKKLLSYIIGCLTLVSIGTANAASGTPIITTPNLSPGLNLPELTVKPPDQPFPGGFIFPDGVYCSGSPNPATTGEPVTWTMLVIGNVPLGGTITYTWSGEHLNSKYGQTVTAIYPLGTTQASVTPRILGNFGLDKDVVFGSPCSVTLADPAPLQINSNYIPQPAQPVGPVQPSLPINPNYNIPQPVQPVQPSVPLQPSIPLQPVQPEVTTIPTLPLVTQPQSQQVIQTVTTQDSTTQTPTETFRPASPEIAPAAPELEPEPEPEPSKCPGINYPSDIEGHWSSEFVKKLYDLCLLSGFFDGTFRPDLPISRAFAVKVVMTAAEIPPKSGCYDADCGSPFMDLEMWQGPWIRGAWDQRVVEGYGSDIFGPNRMLARAEAASLVTRAFKVPAHKGCYSPNCGAGAPNNFFIDITDMWQGPYIRAVWDNKWMRGLARNMFLPNQPITRAELAKMIYSAVGV